MMSGDVNGMLTAVRLVRMHGYFPIWEFNCECGSVVEKRMHKVTSGHTKSCGCLLKNKNKLRSINLAGVNFGRLLALEPAGPSKWSCVCECGIKTVVSVSNLQGGISTSCGCKRKETLSSWSVDFVGKRFGMLTALQDAPKIGKYKMMLCRCDCGGEKVVSRESLSSGNTVSCGCAFKQSHKRPVRSRLKREYSAARSHIRRARAVSVGGAFTAAEVRKLHGLQRGRCASCQCALGEKYHRDHIMPLSLGGDNAISNIQLLCQHCNQVKASKHPIAWAQEQGRLL